MYRIQKQLYAQQAAMQQTQITLTGQADSLQAVKTNLANFTKKSSYGNKHWVLSKVKYLINLADINLNTNANIATTIKLLQMADKHVISLNDPALNNLHRALVADINNLQAVPTVDISGIIIRIDAISKQVAQIPFIPKIVQQSQEQPSQQYKSLWQRLYHNVLVILKNVFVLRHHDTKTQPILSNVEQQYLLQNIDFTLEQAKWAVLHQNPIIYQATLQKTIRLIKLGFSHNPNASKNILTELQKLQQIDIKPQIPDINASKQSIAKVTA